VTGDCDAENLVRDNGRIRYRGQCLYDKGQAQPNNQTCPRCSHYIAVQRTPKTEDRLETPEEKSTEGEIPSAESYQRKVIRHFQNDSKILKRLSASGNRHQKESNQLKEIKRAIPSIMKLHPSFWENSRFLQWQFMRLNQKYREEFDAYWNEYWPWKSGYSEDLRIRKRLYYKWVVKNFEDPKRLYEDILSFYRDFRPKAGEPYLHWRNRLGQFNDQFLYAIAGLDILGTNLAWLIDRHNFGDIFPLPWSIRFPCPMFLQEVRGSYKKGKRKGRPQDLKHNLLVYELSQAGMKHMEIARLFYGIRESTEYTDYKEPALVRINTIVATVRKHVSEAYQGIGNRKSSLSIYRLSPEKIHSPIVLRFNRLYRKVEHTLPPIDI